MTALPTPYSLLQFRNRKNTIVSDTSSRYISETSLSASREDSVSFHFYLVIAATQSIELAGEKSSQNPQFKAEEAAGREGRGNFRFEI